MDRKLPYDPCRRRYLPARLRAEILLRQNGACADCGTRLILGFFVFDHRPSLGLRDEAADANDPERLAAICQRCDERKTPQDLRAIARTKRLAFDHQDFLARQRTKVPGRRVPSRSQVVKLEHSMARFLRIAPPPKALSAPARPRPLPPTRPRTALAAPTRNRTVLSLPAPKGKKE
jgi:5-methylcytosine-specific restriction endonuclease McrA